MAHNAGVMAEPVDRITEALEDIRARLFSIPTVRTARTLFATSVVLLVLNLLQLAIGGARASEIDNLKAQHENLKKVWQWQADVDRTQSEINRKIFKREFTKETLDLIEAREDIAVAIDEATKEESNP